MCDRVRKLRRRARKSLNLRSVSREDTPDTPRAVQGSWTRERTGLEPLCPAAPGDTAFLRPAPFPGHEADAAGFASPLPEVPIIGRALRGVHVILTSGDLVGFPGFRSPTSCVIRREPTLRHRNIRPFPRTEPIAGDSHGMEPCQLSPDPTSTYTYRFRDLQTACRRFADAARRPFPRGRYPDRRRLLLRSRVR